MKRRTKRGSLPLNDIDPLDLWNKKESSRKTSLFDTANAEELSRRSRLKKKRIDRLPSYSSLPPSNALLTQNHHQDSVAYPNVTMKVASKNRRSRQNTTMNKLAAPAAFHSNQSTEARFF